MSGGGSAEVKALEEKILALNSEYDKLNDEWTNKLAAQQDEFQREKHVSEFLHRIFPFLLIDAFIPRASVLFFVTEANRIV